jgi:hypothetical protein
MRVRRVGKPADGGKRGISRQMSRWATVSIMLNLDLRAN